MSEWHDDTPNSGGNGCLGILTIAIVLIALVIAGILLS